LALGADEWLNSRPSCFIPGKYPSTQLRRDGPESWSGRFGEDMTVRLTYLAQAVRIKPNFQGLPWSEFDGLGNDELLTLFLVY